MVNNYQADRPKAPSTIFYRHLDDKNPSWGFTTPQDDCVLRWFKLLLIDEKDLPEKVRESSQVKAARALLHKYNKTPIQVFADYLINVWAHSYPQIAAAEGDHFARVYPLHFVVTLPAIWPHYVRKRMTEAMQLAGLLESSAVGSTKISFISEPEAAALTSLNENAGRYENEVRLHTIPSLALLTFIRSETTSLSVMQVVVLSWVYTIPLLSSFLLYSFLQGLGYHHI
jgi:hypothetical protein